MSACHRAEQHSSSNSEEFPPELPGQLEPIGTKWLDLKTCTRQSLRGRLFPLRPPTFPSRFPLPRPLSILPAFASSPKDYWCGNREDCQTPTPSTAQACLSFPE